MFFLLRLLRCYAQDQTIKTIDNGRIVIIRDGVKRDLSGRKL